MRKQNILRMFLFVVFFSIGAGALSISILCDDLLQYYDNKRQMRLEEESLGQLVSLNADYDALLSQLEKDPDVVDRIAPAALGTEPAHTDAIYPKATAEQLAAARKALMESQSLQSKSSMIPNWLARCSEPYRRVILFSAGACLVLVSFVWFGPAKDRGDQKQPAN